MSTLRDYIAYAKEFIDPKLNDEASQRLIQNYVEMRKAGSGKGVITAYPRQLESLIRLSEAHAKIRLSNIVEVADVEEAFRLHKEAMKQSATDPLTGVIDMSILTTGKSGAERQRMKELVGSVKKQLGKKRAASTTNQALLNEMKEISSVASVLTIIFSTLNKQLV